MEYNFVFLLAWLGFTVAICAAIKIVTELLSQIKGKNNGFSN